MKNPITLPILTREEGLDNSISGLLGRCARKTFYTYAVNRATSGRDYPISFGSAYHLYRETLEKVFRTEIKKGINKVNWLTCFEKSRDVTLENWEDPPLEHKKSYLDRLRLTTTMEKIFPIWKEEKLSGSLIVLSSEAPFQLPLPGWLRCSKWTECDYVTQEMDRTHCPNCDVPGKRVVLKPRQFMGKIDQIVEWNKRIWMRDFKTKNRKVDYSAAYNPNHQMTGYTWGASLLSGGRRVDGAIIDIVYNTKEKGPEFYPTLASRNEGDVLHWLEWAHDKADEWERRIRSGIWTMQTDECDRFGFCRFQRACNTGNWASIEEWLELNTIHSVWDPRNPEDEEGIVD